MRLARNPDVEPVLVIVCFARWSGFGVDADDRGGLRVFTGTKIENSCLTHPCHLVTVLEYLLRKFHGTQRREDWEYIGILPSKV